MSLLSMLGISDAMAAASTAAHQAGRHQGSMMSTILMMVAIFVVFYFLMIRPQQKRAKQQREMLDKVAIGDEVLTGGGIAGKVVRLKDAFLVLKIAKDTEITIQKAAVSNVLPKGTLDSID